MSNSEHMEKHVKSKCVDFTSKYKTFSYDFRKTMLRNDLPVFSARALKIDSQPHLTLSREIYASCALCLPGKRDPSLTTVECGIPSIAIIRLRKKIKKNKEWPWVYFLLI